MEADAPEIQAPDEHVLHTLGCSHPLVLLMPYEPSAPAYLLELQELVWDSCDTALDYQDRLSAALSIRTAIPRLGLGLEEGARVAIDLLQGLHKLLLSAAAMEQLGYAYLDRDGIGLEDRAFSSPPHHPLPVLVRIDRWGTKATPVTRVSEVGDALDVWTSVSQELLGKSQEAIDGMCARDLRASLRMLILFLIHTNLDRFRATHAGKLDRFESMGLSLWNILLARLRESQEHRPDDEERFGAAVQQAMWHRLRSKPLADALATASSSYSSVRSPAIVSPGTHVVVRDDIPAGSNDEDRQTLSRYERLKSPLPVSQLPDLAGINALEERLTTEFPWATSAVTAVAEDLRSRRLFGGFEVGMVPTLLVGQPGCGKSRLARRIAEELTAPYLTISLAGMGDSRAIQGTARGWSSGQASPILNFMLNRSSASALVLLDELDKACSNTRNDGPPTAALLSLLEPENSRVWYDAYLQTACDMSKLMFVATANALRPIPKPLLSRMRIVLVPEPRRADLPAIARGALLDIAREWGLPEDTFAELGDAIPLGAARNAREIRAMARAYLNDWARRSLGPGRAH